MPGRQTSQNFLHWLEQGAQAGFLSMLTNGEGNSPISATQTTSGRGNSYNHNIVGPGKRAAAGKRGRRGKASQQQNNTA